MEVKTLLRITMRNPITLSVISPDKIGYFTLKIQILWKLQNCTSLKINSKNSFSNFRYVSPILMSNFLEEEGTDLNTPHWGKDSSSDFMDRYIHVVVFVVYVTYCLYMKPVDLKVLPFFV